MTMMRAPQRVIRSPREASTLPAGRILFVCQANISRSAYMELLARHLGERAGLAGLEVRSAGLQAPSIAAGVHEQARRRLARQGIETGGHAAAQVSVDDLVWADLIVSASRRQRDALGLMLPTKRASMFTLLQLHRLLKDTDPAEDLQAATVAARLASIAAARRGNVASRGDRDDISDPTGGKPRAYAAAFAAIEAPIDSLIAQLAAAQTHRSDT